MRFAFGRPATFAFGGGAYSIRNDDDQGSVTSRNATGVLSAVGSVLTTNHEGSVKSILILWLSPAFKTNTWPASGLATGRPSPTQRCRASCHRSSGTRRREPPFGRSTTATSSGP